MKRIILILLCFAFCYGNNFPHKVKYKLNKDQNAWILIKKNDEDIWKRYDFSWTLYQDKINIIMHTQYNNFVKQSILSTIKKRSLFKQKLFLTPKTPYDDDLSIFIEFVDFKTKNELSGIKTSNEKEDTIQKTIKPPYAVFNVMIKDKAQKLDVKFYPKESVFTIN